MEKLIFIEHHSNSLSTIKNCKQLIYSKIKKKITESISDKRCVPNRWCIPKKCVLKVTVS